MISGCPLKEEVVTVEGGEEMTNNDQPIFPLLEKLELHRLPKLRRFFKTKRALEFPFLSQVYFDGCPELKMFFQQGSVSAPSLKSVKVVNLSKWFNSKVCQNVKVGQQVRHYLDSSLMDNYNRIMDLEVTETIPLGDCICCLLRMSECVRSSGNGSKNVLIELQLDGFQNVKHHRLADCDSLTHLLKIQCQNNIPFPKLERLEVISCPRLQYIFCLSMAAGSSTVACPDDDDEEEEISSRTHIGPEGNTVQVIKFPNLYYLDLQVLECFTHFCSDTVECIEFPLLRKMHFWFLEEFQNFWPTTNSSNPLFDEKVSCPSLEEVSLWMTNISALCSHQLSTGYFSKLETLKVIDCNKLRNLMSPSVARGVLNLRSLWISGCPLMEEVITEDQEQEEMTNNDQPLFPLLEKLELHRLPKLRHFFKTKRAVEFPFLGEVYFDRSPELKTFVQQGSVSTPSLKSVKVVNLNK